MLISIFYIAYGLGNIFISPIGEKFGPRKSLFCLVTLWAVFTSLGGALGLLFVPFIITRVMLGLSEGIHYSMMSMLIKEWFPMSERSRGNGIYAVGIFLAGLLGPAMLVPLVNIAGWRGMFGILGLIGLVGLLPLVYRYIYDTPRQHPRVTAQEIDYIARGMEKEEEGPRGSLWDSVKPFISSGTFWIAVLCGSCSNAVAHGLLNWLPTYFTQARGLPFNDLWYAVPLPFVFMILSILVWSYLGDRTNRRAVVSAVGPLFAALFIYLSATQESILATVLLFCVASFFIMTYAANEFAIVQHILPRKSIAAGVGVYNGLTMLIGGGVGPVIVGTATSMTGDFSAGIIALAVISVFAAGVMLMLNRVVKY